MRNPRRRKSVVNITLTSAEKKGIEKCVKHFRDNMHLFQIAAEAVMSACTSHPELRKYIHFIKHRVKDPRHLRDKLQRGAVEEKRAGRKPATNVPNLFERITDLAGIRILHLYTDQIANMNGLILEILREQKYKLVEGPVAHIWDHESEQYFRERGIKTQLRDTMYSSVHYVIELSTASRVRCELQVRTLADELWGEVSHTVDYPKPTKSTACREQLKVLARITSACTRLVDSIYRAKQDFEKRRPTPRRPRKKNTG
ncbi:MAG: (p)ppGpp synthetase [Phycisphaerae bacterium]|nr:(p)ppGpp synthetase [Phycisphaerae bacterium]